MSRRISIPESIHARSNSIRHADDEEAGLPQLSEQRYPLTGQPRSEDSQGLQNILHVKSEAMSGKKRFWARLRGRDRRKVGWKESGLAILYSSWLNVLFLLVPFAWAAHFAPWSHASTFALCFLSILPCEKLFDWGGEQLALFCGQDVGDLIVITLNNSVEATLAIILLFRCQLKLLQSTIVGVVVLHLLLIPGTAFLTGGARIWEQQLHPQRSELNHTLLLLGVMALVVPAGFFAAISRDLPTDTGESTILTDSVRGNFLHMGHGFAVVLLFVYVCSRFYIHDPPGEDNAFRLAADASSEEVRIAKALEEQEPELNPWACVLLLIVTVAVMGVTAEFLVESIEFVREESKIEEEWFGLILLPVVSFSADGAVAIVYFVRSSLRHYFHVPQPPSSVAEARAIDLSIQFLLFWMPFVVVLGWWTNKPLTLLFDLFEVTVLVGSCFLVNYVTADAKTNWAEGIILVSFYVMIAISAWSYTGQPDIRIMAACQTVAAALLPGSPSTE